MKKLIIALFICLSMGLIPQPVKAVSWAMATNPVSDPSWFWWTFNGSVTDLTDVTTQSVGFVWDTVSHPDPLDAVPGSSGYAEVYEESIEYSDPFIYTLEPTTAFLQPLTQYFYRFFVCYKTTPVWTYDYGDELFYNWGLVYPEGSWGVYGYAGPDGPTYLQVNTDNAVTVDKYAGDATLNASLEWVGSTYDVWDYGFVVDNVSHSNPSGWWATYSDVAPGDSDYANYYEADGMSHQWDNISYSYDASGWDPLQTYYIRAVADIALGGDWVYGPEIEFVLTDCSVPTLQPPEDLVATPVTGTEIELTWTNPNPQWYTNDCENHTAFYPNLTAAIRMEEWEYPDDPPSLTDNSTLIYQAGAWATGAHSYTVNGLTPGTSYYFRIWFYDSVYGYTDYDEDFATPYAGTEPPEDVDVPDNWFTDPTCDSWENVPGAMVVINGIETDYGLPHNTLCLFINLFLLSCAMTTSFGGVAIVTRRPTGTQTIMVPFIVMCAGFIIGPVIGAFPGFFLAIGVIIGIGVAFAWSRA